jgi:tetratricopeptide (TPR) repeat protein
MGRSLSFKLKGFDDKYNNMNTFYEKAIAFYQKGLELLPEDKKIEESPLGGLWWSHQIPDIYHLTGNFSQELAFYKKYYEADQKIKVYLEKKILDVQKESEIKPLNFLYLGRLYCQIGKYKEAVLSWQKCFQGCTIKEVSPDMHHSAYIADFIMYVCKDYLKGHADDTETKYVLASVYVALGKIEEAKELLGALATKDGFVYKETAKAILGENYQRNVVWAHINTVSNIHREIDPKKIMQIADEVIFNCKKAIELSVKDKEVYWMLGEGYYLKKEYPKATEASLQSLQIEAGFYPALHLLARSYSCNEEYEKALDICLKAIEISGSGGISIPHLSYFYSICRMLAADNRYEIALSYYKKLLELSSKIRIDNKYLNDPNHYDLKKEISHIQYYINCPIKNYPQKLKFKKLTSQEEQNFINSLVAIKVFQESDNVIVHAASLESMERYPQGKPWISWWNATGGTSGRVFLGKLEFEYRGNLKEIMLQKKIKSEVFRIDLVPEEFRSEVINTRERTMKEYLRKTKDYFKISDEIIENIFFDKSNDRFVYSTGSEYKGIPLKEEDSLYGNRNFSAHLLGKYDYNRQNCFEIQNSLYPLPNAEIPTKPLVSEEEAKKIAAKALGDEFRRYGGSGVERTMPIKPEEEVRFPEKNTTSIGKIELVIEPQIISFGDTGYLDLSSDLFEPLYNFAEYRLLWFAKNETERYLVKIDAITGEVLFVRYIGPVE